MTKVLVMLSTFNGERYLKEQIVSILNQRNVDVNIFIRDDGSNDRTQEILNQLSRDNPQKIKWVQGSKNLKPARSYLEIMKLVKMKKQIIMHLQIKMMFGI
ncbi:hypothetical protein ATO00_07135 [Loigolactobacillus coryniformis subsp. coryniformis]|nr:hypothetical protein ATO00_07135 [Loigolactobacillus coryniformis subsp. coryniformis]